MSGKEEGSDSNVRSNNVSDAAAAASVHTTDGIKVTSNRSGDTKSASKMNPAPAEVSFVSEDSPASGVTEREARPSIALQPLELGLHKARYSASADEPVLTLYRRHSQDPFYIMYNAVSTGPAPMHRTIRTEDGQTVEMTQQSSCASGDTVVSNQCSDSPADATRVSGRPGGKAVRDISGGQRSRTVGGQQDTSWPNGDTSHVSLNGIRVGVKKKPSSKKKMVKIQSPRVQCCMCALSVMSALFGMFMLSAGVCLVLNYNFLEVDTSGLPPNLHNEEGKKVVGIILICVGVAALGISGLISTLFYAACSRTSTTSPKGAEEKGQSRSSSQERQGRGHGHYHSNGTTQVGGGRRSGAAGAGANGRRAGNDPRVRGAAAMAVSKDGPSYSRNTLAARNATPPGSARPYRSGKKARHGQSRFRNSLPSHPEEDAYLAGGSRHSASSSRRLAFPGRGGYVNRGAVLDDEAAAAEGSVAADQMADSSVTPPVVIKVDSTYLRNDSLAQHEVSDSCQPSEQSSGGAVGGEADVSSSALTSAVESKDTTEGDNREEGEESGRVSRSTVDSSETAEDVDVSPEEVQKRLDRQMKDLIS